MPMVQQMLQRESGLPVDRSLSPDEAVAHGAAVYAGFLLAEDAAQRPPTVGSVTNVNSHDLGVLGIDPDTGLPRSKVLIPRNTPLPATRARQFVTRRANQPAVVVNVIEGGDASGKNSTSIGKCVVSDLPPGLPAKTPVEVAFTYTADGRLTVSATLPAVGRKMTLDIERASGLSEPLLREWEERLAEGLAIPDEVPGEEPSAPVLAAEEFVDAETIDEAAGNEVHGAAAPVEELTDEDFAIDAESESSKTIDRGIEATHPFLPPPPTKSAKKPAPPPDDDDDALSQFLSGLK
jgi:molecular chaperone DnaK